MTNMIRWAAMGVLLVSMQAFAGSLALSEFGARASGRGTTGVAVADDASSLFYNPANIARLEGLQYSIGGTLMFPRWTFQAQGSSRVEENKTSMVTPPNFAASYRMGETPVGELTLGVGFATPFGSTFDWGDTFTGRAEIRSVALQVFEIAPVVALKPLPWLSIAAGLRFMPAAVEMNQAIRFGTEAEGTAHIGGSGSALAAEAGIAIWPTESLSFGLAWRQGVDLELSGKGDFDFPAPFEGAARDGKVKATLPLAQTIRLGAAYDVTPNLKLMSDLEFQGWSTFDAMTLEITSGTQTRTQTIERHSRDTFVFHLGGELQVAEPLPVRAGYVFDPHVTPERYVSPLPPDSDRHLLTLGASWQATSVVSVHGYFTNVFFAERRTQTNTLPGTWGGAMPGGTMAYLIGLAVSGKIDL